MQQDPSHQYIPAPQDQWIPPEAKVGLWTAHTTSCAAGADLVLFLHGQIYPGRAGWMPYDAPVQYKKVHYVHRVEKASLNKEE